MINMLGRAMLAQLGWIWRARPMTSSSIGIRIAMFMERATPGRAYTVLFVAALAMSLTVVRPATAEPAIEPTATSPTTGAARPESTLPTATEPTPSDAPAPAAATPTPATPTATAPTVTAPTNLTGVPPPPTDGSIATAAPVTPQAIDSAKASLADSATRRGVHADDLAALDEAYAARTQLMWIANGVWSDRANAVIKELKKADDYGLDASAFIIPDVVTTANLNDQGAADVRLSIAALTYARHARGGRIDPVALSSMLDVKPVLRDPKAVLKDLADNAAPDVVLRDLHPKHAEFEALRQALLAARAPAKEAAAAIDPALLVKLPPGKIVKIGQTNDDVALLRQRLKVPLAVGADVRAFDADVEVAVKAFQESQGIKPNGQLNKRTRLALNKEGEPTVVDPKREIDRLIVNMERWRWLPDDLGPLYVMNNVPEFMTRVVKGDQTLFEERIIVGLPTWPTPMLTDSIERIVFNPEWGVPDGIKVKELLPRLRRASSHGGFFDQFFGGGSSGGARVLAAYGLKPSINGRPIDANAVDWNSVDIRRYSFVQPAGGQNPLGNVKFMFPNSHDVYMHDTSSRNLFKQSQRALSHGCIRVENPRRLAEVLLAEDKGWAEDKVSSQYGGGTNDVPLTTPIPVYLTYFTARPGKDGKVTTYGDIYGTDSRIISALAGKPVRFETPRPSEDIADVSFDEPVAETKKKSSSKQGQPQKRKQGDAPGDLIQNAFSGLLFN